MRSLQKTQFSTEFMNMSLSNLVRKFIEKEELFGPSSTLLCGISGGPDSMAMLHLLHSLGYSVIVAHVNYLLRNAESDRDQQIVEEFCQNNRIPFYLYRLSSNEITDLKKGNLQEKARHIRYRFFNEVLRATNADFICTAHHMDDVAETFFLNLNRSSGMKGLISIQAKSDIIRRPLLGADREAILAYLDAQKIHYGTDSTNLESAYDRNYIRNELFPILLNRWPHAKHSVYKTTRILKDDLELLNYFVENEKERWIDDYETNSITIGPLDQIFDLENGKNLLFHMIREYGFNDDQINEISSAAQSTGKLFFSTTHQALINRNQLIVQPLEELKSEEITIEGPGSYQMDSFDIEVLAAEKPIMNPNPNTCSMDRTKVQWPLHIRKWKEGDKIQPLGMDGKHKLISDVLIDQKIDSFSKKNINVVVDKQGEIIWIPGIRLSEVVKYSRLTESFVLFHWNKT